MIPEQELKALRVLLEASHGFELNFNDTFCPASFDSIWMCSSDAEKMIPILARYGHDAITAYGVLRGGGLKAKPMDRWVNENYTKAREEIIELMKKNRHFMYGIKLSEDDDEERCLNHND